MADIFYILSFCPTALCLSPAENNSSPPTVASFRSHKPNLVITRSSQSVHQKHCNQDSERLRYETNKYHHRACHLTHAFHRFTSSHNPFEKPFENTQKSENMAIINCTLKPFNHSNTYDDEKHSAWCKNILPFDSVLDCT